MSNNDHYSYTRLHVADVCDGVAAETAADDGRYVLAVDAICREAVLQGRIRELERQVRNAAQIRRG
jgi:hypothetical protein